MTLHGLSSITIGVPDVEPVREFYRTFGLREDAPGRFSSRDGGEQLVVERAPYRQLLRLGVAAETTADLDAIVARLDALGGAIAVDREREALHVREPVSGTLVEIAVCPRILDHDASVPRPNAPGHRDRIGVPADAVRRHEPPWPSRLSYVVLGTADYEATSRFFTDGLGFEVSDVIPGVGAFMRCSEMHHNLLVQNQPGTLLHHVSWEMDDVDEVGRGGHAIVQQDPSAHVWGLGRHAIGSNYFWYLRDPAGNYAEYSADFDRITAQDQYRPEPWAGAQFLYAWGPPPPIEFIVPPDAEAVFAAQR